MFDADTFERATRSSTHMLIAAARAIPADKTNWKPAPDATTVLGILHHCAMFPHWVKGAVEQGGFPEGFTEGEPGDFDATIALLERNTDELVAFGRGLDEGALARAVSFPWDPNATVAQVLSYHEWNNTYHLGQLNYIQLLYGDTDMHM